MRKGCLKAAFELSLLRKGTQSFCKDFGFCTSTRTCLAFLQYIFHAKKIHLTILIWILKSYSKGENLEPY